MADQPLTGIVQRISHKCTFPAASELEDTKCYICLNDSLGPQGSEVPAKLRCGHIFGMACLVKWVSDSIAEGKASPTCPICRGIFLGRAKFLNYHPSLASSAQQEDDEEQDDDGTTPEQRGRWYRQLIASTRVPGRIEFSETDECFIIRAEHRWVHFCKAIYNHIDDLVDPSESANDLLREYFDEQLPIAQYILSYSTVYNFFVAWLQSNLEFTPITGLITVLDGGSAKDAAQSLRPVYIGGKPDSDIILTE
ncbi:MAG: hypothetical protein L6R41_002069 [Letrouitia leprolyta]|nr:MAG: hypothetical protein L6R41_002069 [Letrouitia leprolyta]